MAELWIPSSVDIDSRLVKRFTLSEQSLVQNPYWLQRVILPVTIVDEILKTPKADLSTQDISGAAYVAFFTVPAGKRWRVKRYQRSATTATSYVRATIGGNLVAVSLTGTTAAADNLDIGLNEGDDIGMMGTGNGADNARTLNLFYDEEDAY